MKLSSLPNSQQLSFISQEQRRKFGHTRATSFKEQEFIYLALSLAWIIPYIYPQMISKLLNVVKGTFADCVRTSRVKLEPDISTGEISTPSYLLNEIFLSIKHLWAKRTLLMIRCSLCNRKLWWWLQTEPIQFIDCEKKGKFLSRLRHGFWLCTRH